MRQLVMLLCVVGVLAAGALADSIDSRSWTVEAWQPDADGNTYRAVRVVDYSFDLNGFLTGDLYGPGDVAEWSLGPITLPEQILTWTAFEDDGSGNYVPVEKSRVVAAETISGVTLRISRPGSYFQFTDLSGAAGVPASWGQASLDPFVDFLNPAELRFELVVPTGYYVVDFSIEAGDFGPSDRDWVQTSHGKPFGIDNHDGAEPFSSVVVDSFPNTVTDPDFVLPDNFYTVTGGSPEMPASVFWDNILFSIVGVDDLPLGGQGGGWDEPATDSLIGPGYLPTGLPAQPIPEPGTVALIGSGILVMVLLRRRRR